MALRSTSDLVESSIQSKRQSKRTSWFRLPKTVYLVVALLLAIAGVASASGSKEAAPTSSTKGSLIRVGIVNLPPEESGYRQANVENMNEVFSKANGYDAKQTNTSDNSAQIAAAMGYIRDGVQYLLISAANDTGWDSVFKAAKAAGVTVFLFDRLIKTDPSNYQAALVSDMHAEGVATLDWLLSQHLPVYNVILIRGQLGSDAEVGRSAPFLQAAKEGKINIVADGTGGDSWSPALARKVVENAIAAGKNFNVIYGENDGLAQGAVQALDAAGITHGKGGKVIIMGNDFNRWALRNVQAGYWNFDQQTKPRQAAEISGWIKDHQAGKPFPTGIIYQKETWVDTANITDQIIQDQGINTDPGKGVITK
jgi:ABC-type sugar transport system substrate-binding protein